MVWPSTAGLAAKRLRQIDSLSTASEPAAGLVLSRRESPADQRTHAERGEEARGDGRALHLFRDAFLPADVHAPAA